MKPCGCWLAPVVLHEGHCCFRDWPERHCHCVHPEGHQGACEGQS